MAFTRYILFTRYTSEQNTTCKGHLAFQKATISLEADDHSFFFHPLTFITINVRQVHSSAGFSNPKLGFFPNSMEKLVSYLFHLI